MVLRRRTLALLGVVLCAGCTGTAVDHSHPTAPHRTASQPTGSGSVADRQATVAYVQRALEVMTDGIYVRSLDWPNLRRQVVAQTASASNPTQTYPALRAALLQVGGVHSQLKEPKQVKDEAAAFAPTAIFPLPTSSVVSPGIASVLMPGFLGTDPAAESRFADAGGRAVAGAAAAATCGWIVDLREDSGGNMWPMLAGLSSLLSQGQVGAFVDPTGIKTAWLISGSVVLQGDQVAASTAVASPGRAGAPLAVLQSEQTGSAGEAVLIAFQGEHRTRSFGVRSAGVPTGNKSFPMPDGAELILTVVNEADRNGTVYNGPIEPDEHVVEPARQNVDRGQAAASTWLNDQCAHSGGHPPN